MTPRASSITLLFLALAATLGACDRRPPPPPPPEVTTAELPGTAQDNAAKAIRELYDKIAEREGVNGDDLIRRIKRDPSGFVSDADAILVAVDIDKCDWGIPRQAFALLPHVAGANAMQAILSAAATDAIEASDNHHAVECIRGQLSLARHLGAGFSLVEALAAIRVANGAFEQTDSCIAAGVLDAQGAAIVLRAARWLDRADPFGIPERIVAEGDLMADAIRDGTLEDASIEDINSGGGTRTTALPPSGSEPLRSAYNFLAAAWSGEEFEEDQQAIADALSKESPQVAMMLPSLTRLRVQEQGLRDHAARIIPRLRSLASPQSQTPSP